MDVSLSLKAYYKDLKKLELIGSEEQSKLAVKAKSGDKKALDDLIYSNLKFVVTIAKEYQYSNIALDDLINEGNIGLIKAVSKFDETKNVRFISYAVWWIRQSIIQFIYDNGNIVRLPCNRININTKIKKAKEILFKELNREPTLVEISEFSDICEADVVNSFNDCSHFVDSENTSNGDITFSLLDVIEGEEFSKIQEHHNKVAIDSEIDGVLSKLNDRESEIIKLYFGLGNNHEMNLREIGKKLNLTNERVRQIKDFALKKLRTYNKCYKLREFLNSDT
jgi:RNA polymerase primary sigma factor